MLKQHGLTLLLVTALLLALFAPFAVHQQVFAAEINVVPANDQGWTFDPDGAPDFGYEYNATPQGASLGYGYLAVAIPAAGADADKFIMYAPTPPTGIPANTFNSFTYHFFLSSSSPVSVNAQQFYINVYVETTGDTIPECRLDFVNPAGLARDTWHSRSFDANTPLSLGAGACPTTLAGVVTATPAAVIALAVNVGQSTGTDRGLIGGLDNITLNLTTGNNTYDFETGEYFDFIVQPTDTQAGGIITPAVQVGLFITETGTLQDAYDGDVTLSIGTNPGGGTLSGTLTVTAISGVATFPNLSINNVGTGYSLIASDVDNITGTSNPFNITAVPPTATPLPTTPPPPTSAPVTGSSDPAPAVAAAPTYADSDYIIKSVDKTLAAIGDTLTFTISFGNPKGNTLNNVVIADTFDSRLSNITIVSSSIGTPVINGNTLTLQGFSLAPGQRATLVITARISNSARAGDTISNTASLESPDASIHFSNVTLTTILPGSLPATGESPLGMLRWILLLIIGLVTIPVTRKVWGL